MAETTIGNLTLGAVDGTSLFEQERTVNGSQVSEKVTASSLANFVGTSAQFEDLDTDAKDLIGAINEAAESGGGASVVQLTAAQYDALSTTEKMNGSIYKLTDKAVMYCLDEEYHALKELTSAQYDALSVAEQNNGTLYIQTDAETTGSDIPVSSSSSETIAEALSKPIELDTIDYSGRFAAVGSADIATRILLFVPFPFLFSDTNYSVSCSRVNIIGTGVFTSGYTIDSKQKTGLLIIVNTTSVVGNAYSAWVDLTFTAT